MPLINKNKNEEVVNNHQKTLVLIKLSNVEVEIYDFFPKKYSIEFNQINVSFGY
jgi:hypothetical protein